MHSVVHMVCQLPCNAHSPRRSKTRDRQHTEHARRDARRDAQGTMPMPDAQRTPSAQGTPATAVAALRCAIDCSCSCSLAPRLEQAGQQRHCLLAAAAVASGAVVEPATARHPTAAAPLAPCTPCRPRPRVSHKQTQGRICFSQAHGHKPRKQRSRKQRKRSPSFAPVAHRRASVQHQSRLSDIRGCPHHLHLK